MPQYAKMILGAVAIGLTVFLSGTAGAAEPLAGDVTVNDIVRGLKPAARTRGLSLQTGTVAPADQPAPLPKLDFMINFEFNSARLSPEARPILDQIGQALNSPDLKPYRFRIAGHTDAVGSARRNKELSLQRAASVRDYLTRNYRISRKRLDTVGFGSERLLDPEHPDDARNRRVEIANLGE